MKTILRYTVFVTILIVASFKAFSQQENTLYFMDRIPQANYLNPAQHPNCSFYVGGLFIPIMGQTGTIIPFIPSPALPLHVDMSTPFGYGDVIYKGQGIQADSLVTFLNSVKDQKAFFEKLKDVNSISMNTQLDFLTFGFRQGKNFWTLDLSTKTATSFSIPKSILTFAAQGNLENRTADFTGLLLDIKAYNELSLGFSRQFSKYFAAGTHVKLLHGMFAWSTPQSEIKLTTKADNSLLTFNTNYEINTTLPIKVTPSADGQRIDKIESKDAADAIKMISSFANKGVALDFGFANDWNSELTIYGSVIDIGFINWTPEGEANKFIASGATEYKGVKVNSLSTNNVISAPNADSVLKTFSVTHKQEAFRTWLNPKIYFGGNYKFTKRIALGVLGRFEKTPYNWENSGTVSLNFKIFRWGAISVSNSVVRNTFLNLGLGTTLRIGPCQWFCIYETNPIVTNSRYFSMRWGGNIVFGRDSEKKRKQIKNRPLMMNFN